MYIVDKDKLWIKLFSVLVIALGATFIFHIYLPKKLLSNYLKDKVSSKNGLHASYFENADWEGKEEDFIEKSPISFKKEHPHFNGNYFSLRYKGILNVPKTGTYCIGTSSDDGSRVYLNGELIVDNRGIHALQKKKDYIYLIKGLYFFQLDYFQAEGEKQLHLFWKLPKGHREVISPRHLFLIKKPFPSGKIDYLNNRYNNWFKVIELFFVSGLVFLLCCYLAVKLNLEFLFRKKRNLLFLILILSIISNAESLNARFWPQIYILHISVLYLIGIYIYGVLTGKTKSLSLKTINLLAGIYLAGFIVLMFFLHLKNSFNIEDVIYAFNDGKRFLMSDFSNMCYPVLANSLFMICRLLSVSDFNLFVIIINLIKFVFLMGLFFFLYEFSKLTKKEPLGSIFSLFILFSPFSINWIAIRYDIIPACLFIGSIFYFYKGRYYLSSLFNVSGFLFKWFPVIAVPFMAVYLFYKKRFRELFRFLSLYLLIILSAVHLITLEGFFEAFLFQGKRLIMGESFFNLFLSWFYGPQPEAGVVRNLPNQGIFTKNILFLLLMGILIILFIVFICNIIKKEKAVIFSCWAGIFFILFNRIYSPQFILWFYAFVFLIAMIKLPYVEKGWIITFLVLLGLASIFNNIIPDRHLFFQERYIYQKLIFWMLFITVSLKLESIHRVNTYFS